MAAMTAEPQSSAMDRDFMTVEDVSPRLPLAAIERIADRFRLLSDPTRLRLVNELHAYGELTVGDLVERLEISYATASKQLAMLRAHGTVARRRDGTKVYYRIVDPSLEELCNGVCRSLREHWANWGIALEAAPWLGEPEQP
jgi:DNA-binding transcriptional ArsR family regulator